MYQYRLYNNHEIEMLKQDLELYKEALESSDTTQYIEGKQQLELLRRKFLKDKGEWKGMEEIYQNKINGYEKNERKLSAQIHAVNYSIEQLKNDIQTIKSEVKELRAHELLEKIDQVLGKTDIELDGVKNQVKEQKNEFNQIKAQLQTQNKPKQQDPNHTSEYRQLQRMLKSARSTERVTPPPSQSMVTRRKQSTPISKDLRPITMQNGNKTFYNTKYELNKNIIVKKTTAKTKRVKREIEEETAIDNTSITPQSENETPPEPTIEKEPVIETIEPNIPEVTKSKNMTDTEQEFADSTKGIKKTWLLAKSLWKK